MSHGAIHVHWFAYLKDAPVYGEAGNEEVVEYFDQCISYLADVPEEHKKYLQYQYHRHSRSCRVGTTNKYQFHFPQLPIQASCVLELLLVSKDDSEEEKANEEEAKAIWKSIFKYFQDLGMATDNEMTFAELLAELKLIEE